MNEAKKRLIHYCLVIIAVCSCSAFNDISDIENTRLVNEVEPNWYANSEQRFQLVQDNLSPALHFFFDPPPSINIKNQTLTYVVETPSGSDNKFKIDLRSGQHYLDHEYCSEPDIYEKFDSKIKSPPFSIGIVPRVYDQLGSPQRILVFGNEKQIRKQFQSHFFEARIIGGFIEQTCDEGACLRQGEWQARLVLVGVDKTDKSYRKIESIDDLKKKVDWKYVDAFLKNGFGNNKLGDKFYPSHRVGAFIGAKDSLNFFKDNTVFFTKKKIVQMRKSCHKLYDVIWNTTGEDSEIESKLRKAKDLKELATLNQTLRKNKDVVFNKRFIKVYRQYYKSFSTCQQFVYPANLNENPERFRFFTYYTAINLLNELGYSFNCNSQIWSKNPYLDTGKKYIPVSKEFFRCSPAALDRAFLRLPSFLEALKNGERASYRFVDYDNSPSGTHNKIYSLVPVTNKLYQCRAGTESRVYKEVFPKDLKWKRREIRSLSDSEVIF